MFSVLFEIQLLGSAVRKIEKSKVGAANQELKQAYDAGMAEYHNRLAQIDATSVRDLIRKGSDAAKKAVIDEEIKKHCLIMLTREFDTDRADDQLTGQDAMGYDVVSTVPPHLVVGRRNTRPTTIGYCYEQHDASYPAVDIQVTREKGRVVQFLEQAFEWERLSYVFYPYFWAAESRWVEVMNRADDAGTTFTAFLRSGTARVLLAVTPDYDDAVLHYLATREAWDGAPAPVIGDPLFIPRHEELRQQQDDRTGGSAEGEPWTFTVPTSLAYLHGSEDKLPNITAERAGDPGP